MNKINNEEINYILQSELGIELNTILNNDNNIEVTSKDFDTDEGFKFETKIGLQKISYIFTLQKKSRFLFEQIKKKSIDNFQSINFHKTLLNNNKKIIYYFDNQEYSEINEHFLDTKIFSFSLVEYLEEDIKSAQINEILSRSLIECFQHFFLFYKITKKNKNKTKEGEVFFKQSKKFERDINNRILCISAKGVKCYVCKFDFEKTYGEIGNKFIHVHHVIPISEGVKNFDPLKDLIPVCPNCHAMLHKKIPPYSVEELREILRK